MTHFLFGIFAFVIGISIWAAIGHLFWIVCRSLVKAIFGQRCDQCGVAYLSVHRCPLKSPQPTLAEDLSGARRLLDYATGKQWLRPTQRDALGTMLNDLQGRVRAEASGQPLGRQPNQSPSGHADETPASLPPATVSPGVPLAGKQPKPPERAGAQPHLLPTDGGTPPVLGTLPSARIHAASPQSPPPAAEPWQPGTAAVANALPHPLDAAEPAEREVPSFAEKRERFTADILYKFMAESNIRWIELISAGLIVICSVGLVISLWSTLSATSRFFPSLVFLAATLAVHGAGQYTLGKWKLQSTSRGILHIGLMLIPLSMLVGILLARREGVLPALDLMTISVVAIGVVVYSSLAISASRSLFVNRWPLVAAANIVGTLLLIPIDFLAQHQQLETSRIVLLLIPLGLISLAGSLSFAARVAGLQKLSEGKARKLVGSITQILFSCCIVLGFWYLQNRTQDIQSLTWWISAGGLATVWAGLSWTVCLSRPQSLLMPVRHAANAGPQPIPAKVQRKFPDWLVIAAWVLSLLCSIVALAAVTHLPARAVLVSGLLAAAGVWWIIFGLACNQRLTTLLGTTTTLVGLSLAGTILPPEARPQMHAIDWLQFTHVATLTCVGLLAAVAGVIGKRFIPANVPPTATGLGRQVRRLDGSMLADAIATGGGLLVLAGTALTVVSSLTQHGGQWASPILLIDSLLLIASSIYLQKQAIEASGSATSPQTASHQAAAVPAMLLGQVMMGLACVQLAQTNLWLSPLLNDLRPGYSWAVGLAAVVMAWSALAAVLRCLDFLHSNQTRMRNLTNLLTIGAVVAALPSGLAMWFRADQLWLAAHGGWFIPLSCLAILLGRREAAWREATLIAASLWAVTLAIWLGQQQALWMRLGLAGSAAGLVSLATLVLLGNQLCILWLEGRSPFTAGTAPASTTGKLRLRGLFQDFADHNSNWASTSQLVFSWGAMLVPLVILFSKQVGISLGKLDAASEHVFLAGSLSVSGSLSIAAAFVLLAAATAWLGRIRGPAQLDISGACGSIPLACAMLVAVSLDSVNVMSAFLWVLAGWLVCSEGLRFGGTRMAKASHASWRRFLMLPDNASRAAKVDGGPVWLLMGRGLTLLVLLFATAGYWLYAVSIQDAQTAANFWFVSGILGPLFCMAVVRWLLAVWASDSRDMIFICAVTLAVCMGGGIALLSGRPVPDTILQSLGGLAITASSCAWLAVIATASRNYTTLKFAGAGADMGAQGRQAGLPTVFSGRRWREAEAAAWQTNSIATTLWVMVSLFAAIGVVAFPIATAQGQSIPGLQTFGGLMPSVGFLLAGSLAWLLARRRPKYAQGSGPGLLALVLGLFAPLAAAASAAWLTHSARVLTADVSFIPPRVLMCGWLAALAIGLILQYRVHVLGQRVSGPSRFAWLTLGGVVAGPGIVCTTCDPTPWWPLGELSMLAVMAVLSGTMARSSHRHHLAAMLASIALVPWLLQWMITGGGLPLAGAQAVLLDFWNLLWGPVWVACLALASRQLWNHRVPPAVVDPKKPKIPSVDRNVSLHVAAVSLAASLAWIFAQESNSGQWTVSGGWVLGLAVTCLGLSISRLWDRQGRHRGLGVYLNVISASAVLSAAASSHLPLSLLESLLMWLASILAAMALMAGALRELTLRPTASAQALGLVHTLDAPQGLARARQWMPVVHTLVSVAALLPTVLLVLLLEERSLRIAATALPFLGVITILPITGARTQAIHRYAALLLSSVALVLIWWGDLPRAWAATSPTQTWIYWQRLLAALVTLGLGYSWLSSWLANADRQAAWAEPLHRVSWIVLLLGGLTGLGLLQGQAVGYWSAAAEDASVLSKLTSLMAWSAIVWRLVQFAARPQGLDRSASETLRKSAVYAAQLALVAVCGSGYFHFPGLFEGIFLLWWPVIVFGIALISALLGHWLQRNGEHILSEPLEHSGLLLPIVPLVGVMWWTPELAPLQWNDWDVYALLLLGAAGIYGMESVKRKSLGLRAFSAGLLLASYWSFLHSQPDFRFLEHPQFWLLPPAIATLGFVQWNQSHLRAETVAATRYIALLVAYLSSSAEVFLQAFAGGIWQPVVLLGLALSGVGAGIALQVRSFLYCGVTFTFLALVGMVWHAQQAIDQVWPWWALGIGVGVGLIILLGYAEKNRPAVTAYIQRIKGWQS